MGHGPLPAHLVRRARELRGQETDAERVLWRVLRARQIGGFKFRRQHTVAPFILDFYCPELQLAIELDGGQHFETLAARADGVRSHYLAGQQIEVLRFSNRDVLLNLEAVLRRIWDACASRTSPSPPPSPQRERV